MPFFLNFFYIHRTNSKDVWTDDSVVVGGAFVLEFDDDDDDVN